MSKPKTKLRLHAYELKHLKPVDPDESGGHQALHRWLQEHLQDDGSIEFEDAELGWLIRLMGYGSGGFQGRLRKGFGRAIRQHAGLD